MVQLRFLLFLLFIANIFAVNNLTNPIINKIKSNLKTSLPDLQIDEVNPSIVPNIYEVTSGRKVFYVDSTGRYAFLGNLVDLTTKQSLTQQRVEALTIVDWTKLPLNIALKQIIGNGQGKIAVFTDPDCPFCKRLEQDTIPKLTNVTVYYFLFPLSIHANAESDAKKILCSEIPDKTYIDWMKDGKTLPIRTNCKNGINQLNTMKDIGNKVVQVEATPTIVLQNGSVVTGFVPADYLNKLIIDTSSKAIESANQESSPKSITKSLNR